jgi:hypothetical protein
MDATVDGAHEQFSAQHQLFVLQQLHGNARRLQQPRYDGTERPQPKPTRINGPYEPRQSTAHVPKQPSFAGSDGLWPKLQRHGRKRNDELSPV